MGIEAILESLKEAFDEYKVPLPLTAPPPFRTVSDLDWSHIMVGERVIYVPSGKEVVIVENVMGTDGSLYFKVCEAIDNTPSNNSNKRRISFWSHSNDLRKADPPAPAVQYACDPDITYSGTIGTTSPGQAFKGIDIPQPGAGWMYVCPLICFKDGIRLRTITNNQPPLYYIHMGEGCEPLDITHQPGQLIVKEYSRGKFNCALLHQWKRIKPEEQPRPVYDGFPMLKALNFPAPAKRPADDLGE